jgi:hypothetical protein
MAGTERDRIRLEGDATSVIGAVVEFYERHLQDRHNVEVEELRGMKRVVMGQHNRAYVALELRVNGLIEGMEKHVKRGVYGFLEQMSYNMCKILQLTAAASIYEFGMQRYRDAPEGLNRVGGIAQELGKDLGLDSKQTKMVSDWRSS